MLFSFSKCVRVVFDFFFLVIPLAIAYKCACWQFFQHRFSESCHLYLCWKIASIFSCDIPVFFFQLFLQKTFVWNSSNFSRNSPTNSNIKLLRKFFYNFIKNVLTVCLYFFPLYLNNFSEFPWISARDMSCCFFFQTIHMKSLCDFCQEYFASKIYFENDNENSSSNSQKFQCQIFQELIV